MTEPGPTATLEPSDAEKATRYFAAIAEAMEILQQPVGVSLSAADFGRDMPAPIAASAVVHALVLLAMGMGREQSLPTAVLVEVLTSTLGWVQDPNHVLGKGRVEYIEEIVPPVPKE